MVRPIALKGQARPPYTILQTADGGQVKVVTEDD